MQERLKEAAIIAQVRRRLEAAEGLPLPEGRAPVGRKADGTMRQHTFDLLADDRALVGEIRTYTLGEGGGRPSGRFAHCYAACLFLYRARAKRKVLVLTDRAFWSRFRRESEGLLEGIDVLHVPIDDTAPIIVEVPAEEPDLTPPPRRPQPRRPAAERPRGFVPEDMRPAPRRNKGGPGPRGRRPNTGQQRKP